MILYPCRTRSIGIGSAAVRQKTAHSKLARTPGKARPLAWLLEHFPPLHKPVEFIECLFIAVAGDFFTDFAHLFR